MPDDPHKLNSALPNASDQPGAAAGTAAYTKLANEAGVSDSAGSHRAEGPGARIGPYKVLQEIGEGGMGTVFMAEQLEPVRRMVALKVIKLGMDSKEVLARFEAERQALALMDHPNIAKVLDSGTTDSGRPYFGMELVKGIPITKYCDEHQLTPRERLVLFVPVCQAIQHAHQKGVIHRDIKPSNVLVASYDGKPVPKVIDFGVAKAMGQKLTERTMFTALGHIIGTFEYMSPEQAELNALDIDTRSDIYSLGVLLYQLLTGSTPLSRKRLKEASLQEAMRLIWEEEPPKPSTRLSELGRSGLPSRTGPARQEGPTSLASLSAQRKTEPAKLTKMMRGELDWIVMKALEKDRSRRYETASGLARDIERYLHDEPVEACPPSATYRLRKLARRYRIPLRVAALCLLLLVAGVVVSAWQAIRATQAEGAAQGERDRAIQAEAETRSERDRAVKAENNALAKEQLATANEWQALESETEARAVLEFFLNKVLAAARPEGQQGGLGIDVSIRAAIDTVEPQIAKAFQDKPLIEASIRHTLGLTYFYLGDYTLAIPQHDRALTLRQAKLGLDHPDTLTSMDQLASGYQSAGRQADATALREELLKLSKGKLGPDHPDTLTSMHGLGIDYLEAGRLDEALALLEKTLELRKAKLGPEDPQTLGTMNNLAKAYQVAGRLDDAVSLFKLSIKLHKAKLGPGHQGTLISMDFLAKAYVAAGRLQQALELHEETLTLRKAKLGPDHGATLVSMNNLALAYSAAGRLQEALALHEETLTLRKAKLGPDHPAVLFSMNHLAVAYRDAGRLKEAIPLFEETLRLRKAKLGPDHPQTLTSMNDLARAYPDAGRLAEALTLYQDTFKLSKAKLGPDHAETLTPMSGLGNTLVRMKKYAEAEPILRECLALREQKRPDDWNTFHTKCVLGASLLGQKKYADAEPLLLKGYEGMKQREAKMAVRDKGFLVMALRSLVQLYEATGQPEQLAQWRKELEAANKKQKESKK